MEKETKHYVESINHVTNWLNTITIDIDTFLVYREYMNFFMKIYMKWSKGDGSTSSSKILIIPSLPCFDKLALTQLQLYIESQTTTQCFVCRNRKKTILIQSAKGEKKGFCI